MRSQVVHTGTKAGSQGDPSQLEDCHQSKQVIPSKARQLADQQVCAPGRTRTCTLRIRSRDIRRQRGVECTILTNGSLWQVYHVSGGLPVAINLALEVDLLR
jgi:hypothetical protein